MEEALKKATQEAHKQRVELVQNGNGQKAQSQAFIELK